jgi:hypothetical protein
MNHRFTVAVLAAALLCAPAFAADRPGRFTLDVKVDGSGHQAKGREHSRFTTEESMHVAFTLVGSGVPEDTNPLDIAGNAAVLQKQVDEANARAPSRDQQKAVMERARATMEACKGDMACMQKAAQALALQTSSWSVRPASPGANAGRFLTYAAASEGVCRPEFQARLRNNADGEFADVQGLVPFTNKTTADFKASALQSLPLCTGMLVVDARANTIFIQLQTAEVKGRVVRVEGSHTRFDNADAGVRLNQDALEWVAKQLQGAAKSGKQRTTLKIPTNTTLGGIGEKIINVEMSWNFNGK